MARSYFRRGGLIVAGVLFFVSSLGSAWPESTLGHLGSVLTPLIKGLQADPYFEVLVATREEEAAGIVTGAWMGGGAGAGVGDATGGAGASGVAGASTVTGARSTTYSWEPSALRPGWGSTTVPVSALTDTDGDRGLRRRRRGAVP